VSSGTTVPATTIITAIAHSTTACGD